MKLFGILIILLFTSLNLFGQDSKKLNGLLFNEDKNPLTEINIINLTHISGAVSNRDGYFSINGYLGDTLLFSSVNFVNQSLIISDSIFNSGHIELMLKLDHVNLQEIDLTSFNMMDTNKTGGPVKMSLPFKHDVVYKKPSQREFERLKFSGANVVGSIISSLNGQKKAAKMVLKKESEDAQFEKVRNKFDNSFYLKLGVPENEINNFIDYYFNQAEAENLFSTENTFKLIELITLKSKSFIEGLEVKTTDK